MKRVLLIGEHGDIPFDFTAHKYLITTTNKNLERGGKKNWYTLEFLNCLLWRKNA